MRKGKKIFLTSTIAIAFFIALIASFVLIFSVRNVKVSFSDYEESQSEQIVSDLSAFNGRNLFFLKEDEIFAVLDDYPYYETVSVEKAYPNEIKVSLKKRVEVYTATADGQTVVLDKEGYVLKKGEGSTGRVISLVLDGISWTELQTGKKAVTSSDGLFYSAIRMAQAVKLTDCVETMTVIERAEKADVEFTTYTGVTVCVENGVSRGEEKAVKAFAAYEEFTDYQKTFNSVKAYETNDGNIRVTWTSR